MRICKDELSSLQFHIYSCAAECDRHVDSTARRDPRRIGHGRLAVREEAAAAGCLVGRQRHTGQHRRKQSSDRRLKIGVIHSCCQPLSVSVVPTLIYVPKKHLFSPKKLNKLSLKMKHCEKDVQFRQITLYFIYFVAPLRKPAITPYF